MNIPENLSTFYDDRAATAHEKMASTPLRQHVSEMPALQTLEVGDQHIKYAELEPEEASNHYEAVLLQLPYANGWAPHMYLRARYLQNVMAPRRMIVIPSNTRAETAYDFTDEQLQRIKSGDLKPIAERQARLVKELGIGRVSIVGYSFGGMSAAVLAEVLADEIAVLSVGSFEAPNVVERTAKQLEKDFKAGGFKYLKAAQDAEVPALTEALGAYPWSPKVIKGVASFGVSSLLKGNSEIKQAMAKDNLSDGLGRALDKQSGISVLLANAAESRVAPTEAVARHAASLHNRGHVRHITVKNYDHGMGDNIVVHGLLGKAAVEG